MVGGRVVKIDGALDEAQAERAGVESDVAPRITGDGGDVVEAGESERGGGGRVIHY
jgi:hypothetical protein